MDKLVEVHFVRRYRQEQRLCAQCGSAFLGPVLRRYCTEGCRLRAAWHRNGPAYRAAVKARKEQGQ